MGVPKLIVSIVVNSHFNNTNTKLPARKSMLTQIRRNEFSNTIAVHQVYYWTTTLMPQKRKPLILRYLHYKNVYTSLRTKHKMLLSDH